MVTAQYQAALHSYAEGRYEEAMQQFSELLHEDPRNPKLHIWLGATFRKAGKMEYAKVQYQQVLTLTDDPDLLDLASTSLAQIQNKLASGSHNLQESLEPSDRPNINETPVSKKVNQADKAQEATYRALQREVQNTRAKAANSIPANSIPKVVTVDHFIETIGDSGNSKIKIANNGQGNGKVPPPPVFLLQNSNEPIEEQQNSTQLQQNENPLNDSNPQDLTELIATPVSKDPILNIQENQNPQEEVLLPPVESVILGDRQGISRNDSAAIALEDMFKLSSVSQKITLWGALIATIPAIALGVAAYQVGNGLLLSKTKQAQKAEAIVLANLAGNFLKQKTADVEVLQKLLVSTELEQKAAQPSPNSPNTKTNTKPTTNVKAPQPSSIAQQNQYKQQLTNRLNLYAQAYPKYTSIALFGSTGDLISQSVNSKTLQTISSDLFKRSTAANTNAIVTVGKGGTHLYIFAPIKSVDSQKISMFLQVEVPVQQLVNELTPASNDNGSKNSDLNRDFYVIDSANKYIASSQSVTLGGDASTNFEMLADWRTAWQTSQSSEILDREQNGQMFAYVPIPKLQTNDLLNWDLVTSVDKTKAIAGNQNLLLVVGLGIASTPLLMLMVGYALSRKLSTRLKHIRMALRDLREGRTDLSFGNLSTAGNDELSDISLSINKMSEQFQTASQKQELEKQNLQLQVAKLFKVLAKLAREDNQEILNADLSDEKILFLGKKVRAEIVQRHAEVEQYRQQREEIQGRLLQMLKDVQALADGDLTVSTQSVDGSLANVAIFFDDVMRGLQNIIAQVKSSANQVNLSLGQNEQAIDNLCDASQRQFSMLTHSLDTIQISKLATTAIVGHSQQVSESSQLVVAKISDSDRSIDAVMSKVGELQNTVAATAKRIKHLGMSSQKVVKAISTINEIAIKTNFLAINASLEASRTGDVNVGFVMVAEEVGELAARSVAASKEVESLLINIQAETNAVMASVESGSNQISESNTLAIAAKDNLQQIAHISQEIDGLMGAIAEATISQVQTSEGVANLMHDIAHMAKTTIASSSEASKLIKTTRKYSGELQESLIHFKTR